MADGEPTSGGALGGLGRALRGFVIFLVVVALAGVVVFLASEINARRYRLSAVNGQLVIEKGRHMPVGWERYIPEAGAMAKAYEPIPMPEGESFPQAEEFDDRADLDRALFTVLAGWARKGMQGDAEALTHATAYIERSELLPGLSEQQRLDLKTLRADLAYRRGRQMVDDAGQLLVQALAQLRLAKELGTSRPNDADSWIQELERRIVALGPRSNLPAEKPPELGDKPPEAPAAAAPVAPSGEVETQRGHEPSQPDNDGKWRL